MNAQPETSSTHESHPHQASSDEADPEKGSSPAGVVGDLRELADDSGGTTDPDDVSSDPAADPESQP